MARVAWIDPAACPALSGLAETIRGGRRGTLSNIYRLMLHSPALAEAWYRLNSATRWQTELDGRTRELVILRVAALTGCDYVLGVHRAVYAPEEGLDAATIDALGSRSPTTGTELNERERATLAYVEAVTRDVVVPAAVYRAFAAHWTERQVVEITMLAAAYNMLARVLVALEADPERPPPGREADRR